MDITVVIGQGDTNKVRLEFAAVPCVGEFLFYERRYEITEVLWITELRPGQRSRVVPMVFVERVSAIPPGVPNDGWRWTRVSVLLPAVMDVVIMVTRGGVQYIGVRDESGWYAAGVVGSDSVYVEDEVTHWCPLLSPPSD